MSIRSTLLFSTHLTTLMACSHNTKEQSSQKSQYVILKLDAWYEEGLVHPGWIHALIMSLCTQVNSNNHRITTIQYIRIHNQDIKSYGF